MQKIKIDSIEDCDITNVYDIEVEDAHHYILENNVISHNSGPAYANSCTLELSKAQYKQGDDVIGGIFTAKALKNRLAREKTKVKFKINFKTGLQKYSGLDLVAVELGWLILPERARTYRVNIGGKIPEECQGKTKEAKDAFKEWLSTLPAEPKSKIEDGVDEEFWENFLQSGFADELRNLFKYGADFNDGELDFTEDISEDLDKD